MDCHVDLVASHQCYQSRNTGCAYLARMFFLTLDVTHVSEFFLEERRYMRRCTSPLRVILRDGTHVSEAVLPVKHGACWVRSGHDNNPLDTELPSLRLSPFQ